MSPELSPRPLARPGLPAGRRGVAGERRGDFLGAQPGTGPSRPRRPALQRLQVCARRPGQPCWARRDRRVPVGGHARPLHRPVRAHRAHLPGPARGRGIIQACDPDIIAARIKRADWRPKGWDLDLSLIRADLTDTEVAVLGRQFPGLGARAAAAACPDTREAPDGGQSPHPASPVDNPADRVQLLHPASGTGCNQRTDEVQPAQSRGATAAPEPSKEPYLEPPAAAAGVCEASLAGGAAGGGRAGEFFAALGDGWRLTPTQRLKLVPAVTAALERGWAPRVLAAFAGANTNGVRNPYAVLTARLSPAGLPPPQRPARPPWCGQCDQTTRMLGFHSDAPRPCPRCKPACTQQDRPGPRRPLPPRSPSARRPALVPARPGIANPSQSTGREARRHRPPGPSPPARQ